MLAEERTQEIGSGVKDGLDSVRKEGNVCKTPIYFDRCSVSTTCSILTNFIPKLEREEVSTYFGTNY